MDFSKYKFRCSSLGYLLTPVRGKTNAQKYEELMDSYDKKLASLEKLGPNAVISKQKLTDACGEISIKLNELKPIKDKVQLSDSAKTHLCDLYTAMKYNRHEDIKSKYLEKGLHSEEDAITLYSLVTNEMYHKNTERRENEWITGEMDFPSEDEAINDTKVNWSIFQFTRVVAKPLKPLYKWQGKGYMWLWEREKCRIIYCLINTPKHLIEIEKKRFLYDFIGTQDDLDTAYLEIERLHTYDDIPNEERVRIFMIERDIVDEEIIKRYVEAGREFLNNIDNKKIDQDESED